MKLTPRSAILVLGVSVLAQCSKGDESCALTVAWDPYEPYSYETDAGIPAGFDIDVVTSIAERMGCDLNFVQLEWDDVLLAIETGGADVAVGTSYYPARAEWSWYAEPYRDEVTGLLIRRDETDRFPGSTLRELLQSGLRFGMTEGDTYGGDIGTALDAFHDQILPRTGERDNISRLVAGEIDGLLIERRVGAAHLRRMGLMDQATFHPLAFPAGRYRLQLSKATTTPDRLAQVNAALQHLKFTGALGEISTRYDMTPPSP